LPQSPGIQHDEILAEVIGFLEACQERMFDLIEAGTQGLLSEDIFELCLRVNDAVLRTLEAEKVRVFGCCLLRATSVYSYVVVWCAQTGTPIPIDDETTAAIGETSASGGAQQVKTSSGAAGAPKLTAIEVIN
jgi:hypothetical protein